MQQSTQLTRIGHVELRVRNLERSAAFYCELFGFARRSASVPYSCVCTCVGVPSSGCEEFSVVLVEGLPQAAELAGLDHVSFRVLTEQDVRDTHERAVAMQIRCTSPRRAEDSLQMFLFDPDGYKLEIAAPLTSPCSTVHQDT